MEEEPSDPLYTISLIGLILFFNIVVATATWFCFNLFATISLTDAFAFVVVFRIMEWAKQTIIEMCFG